MSDDALFKNAHGALLFALNFSIQQHAPSPMERLLKIPKGQGKGLGGLDGAAQAGMIRAELKQLGELGENVLTARVAVRSLPCECRRPCCSGSRANPEWAEAVAWLAEHARRALSGSMTNYRLRRGIVERHFGAGVKLSELARYCNVNKDTASAHNSKVVALLKQAEGKAWHEIEEKLKLAQII